jgi:type IV pilus assembly protein PilV
MKTLKQQSGIMLLEALIAILIFSIGILAIIGLQAAAISASTDAKYRSDASLLANQLIGDMWNSDRTAATLQANFQTGGTAYNSWLTVVQSTLPMVAANPPTVVVAPSTTAGNIVTISIFWRLPSETAVHTYSTIVPII